MLLLSFSINSLILFTSRGRALYRLPHVLLGSRVPEELCRRRGGDLRILPLGALPILAQQGRCGEVNSLCGGRDKAVLT